MFGSLFGAFGLAALVMAAAGLYGVLAFGVRLRTQEIGVRIALGAGRRQVVGLIMRQGMLVVGIGLAAGLGIGWLAGPLMSVLFFNVSPTDPIVMGSTIAVLLVLSRRSSGLAGVVSRSAGGAETGLGKGRGQRQRRQRDEGKRRGVTLFASPL